MGTIAVGHVLALPAHAEVGGLASLNGDLCHNRDTGWLFLLEVLHPSPSCHHAPSATQAEEARLGAC